MRWRARKLRWQDRCQECNHARAECLASPWRMPKMWQKSASAFGTKKRCRRHHVTQGQDVGLATQVGPFAATFLNFRRLHGPALAGPDTARRARPLKTRVRCVSWCRWRRPSSKSEVCDADSGQFVGNPPHPRRISCPLVGRRWWPSIGWILGEFVKSGGQLPRPTPADNFDDPRCGNLACQLSAQAGPGFVAEAFPFVRGSRRVSGLGVGVARLPGESRLAEADIVVASACEPFQPRPRWADLHPSVLSLPKSVETSACRHDSDLTTSFASDSNFFCGLARVRPRYFEFLARLPAIQRCSTLCVWGSGRRSRCVLRGFIS